MANRKSVSLQIESLPPLPEVTIDGPKIGQVMGNVLSNAVKFTPKGGTVSIRAEHVASGFLRIDISDTGIGIPPEHLDQVFEKFGSHQRRGTEGEHGTGLGMPIVKRFVELHEGSIEITSELSKGTTVSIQLPIQRAGI